MKRWELYGTVSCGVIFFLLLSETGKLIGIGIGGAVVFIILVILLIFFLLKMKKYVLILW